MRLLPGTSADVEVILETRENVLRVPTPALLEGNRVLVVEKHAGTSIFPKAAGLANVGVGILTTKSKPGHRAIDYLDRFIAANPKLWNEDIGEPV